MRLYQGSRSIVKDTTNEPLKMKNNRTQRRQGEQARTRAASRAITYPNGEKFPEQGSVLGCRARHVSIKPHTAHGRDYSRKSSRRPHHWARFAAGPGSGWQRAGPRWRPPVGRRRTHTQRRRPSCCRVAAWLARASGRGGGGRGGSGREGGEGQQQRLLIIRLTRHTPTFTDTYADKTPTARERRTGRSQLPP